MKTISCCGVDSTTKKITGMTENELLDEFTDTIGAGGYGVIVRHTRDPLVIKLIKSKECTDAGIEYMKQSAIYDAFEKASHHARGDYSQYSQICVPKPYGFNQSSINKFGNRFGCFYVMDELYTLDKTLGVDNGLYHITLDGRNQKIGSNVASPVSDYNPSRGFFANYDYIDNVMLKNIPANMKGDLTNMNNILKYMGYAFGVMVFIADYYPTDVEYTIGLDKTKTKLCMDVLDFGMIHKINYAAENKISPQKVSEHIQKIGESLIDSELDINIYYPEGSNKYFIQGLKDAYLTAEKIEKDNTILQRKKQILNHIIENWE